jgi:hypothetical protein
MRSLRLATAVPPALPLRPLFRLGSTQTPASTASTATRPIGTIVAGLRPPSKSELDVISNRQLLHPVNAVGVASRTRCMHGHPQAFVSAPVSEMGKFSSGIFRLTCPWLVKAVDEWEAEGAVREMNRRLNGRKRGALPGTSPREAPPAREAARESTHTNSTSTESTRSLSSPSTREGANEAWKESLGRVHAENKRVRGEMMTDAQRRSLSTVLGSRVAEHFMGSGT